MKITEELLKKVLVKTKAVSPKDFDLAREAARVESRALENVLVEKGLVSDEQLGQLLADEFKFPFVELKKVKISPETLAIIPEIVARAQKIIAFNKGKEGLKVASSDPGDLEVTQFLAKKTGEQILPYFATAKDIELALRSYKKSLAEEMQGLLGEAKPSAIKIVDLILESAQDNRASDIHFEPSTEKTIVRFRIDGVLHDVLQLPKAFHELLLSRIKILAKLRTDLHDSSQDGRFSFGSGSVKIDIRVSVVPLEQEEKAVLRLLSEGSRQFDLADLGLQKKDAELVEQNIKKPWGMVLISGPAGSGKTTSLYAILKILNTRQVNIMTIEDPIEYDIEGVNQLQVNAKTNLTFSEGLKAIVRQNPDIIMVGEIRDEETASLAVNAAMTGHLVLSTFHANDAATALPRLEDMGVEPFLLTSTLNLVISQRLVRKICPKCVESYELPLAKVASLLGKELAEKLPKTSTDKVRLFRGRGCPLCQETGYLGRTGIFEVLEMRDFVKKLIMAKASAGQIQSAAEKEGFSPILEDGLEKVENGVTTLDEVLRAVKT